MRIAILYICTGKYNQFFEGFYQSAEKYLLKDIAMKDYYVFTDDMNLCSKPNVFLNFKKCEGFPWDSLYRFRTFLTIKDKLIGYEYIYFFNSNALFLQDIDESILPDNGCELVNGVWPIHRRICTSYHYYPYERNKKSLAYVAPFHKPYTYYMGGIHGGTANAFLEMSEVLNRNIQIDLENGIVAKVHDQSHINKYLRSHSCKPLGKEYCSPEEWVSGFEPKMIFRDKVKIDPITFSKGRDKSIWGKIKELINLNILALQWYL